MMNNVQRNVRTGVAKLPAADGIIRSRRLLKALALLLIAAPAQVHAVAITANSTAAANGTAGVTLSTTMLTVNEGGNASYTLRLNTEPTSNVTITVTRTGDTSLEAAPAVLTFTPGSWNSTQTVTITAAQDDDARDETAVFAHQAASTDTGYDGLIIAQVTVTENDNDQVNTIRRPVINVQEGRTTAYDVLRLTSEPETGMTLTLVLASGSSHYNFESILFSPAMTTSTQLVFTPDNWNIAQSVTLSAAEEDDAIRTQRPLRYFYSSAGSDYNASSNTPPPSIVISYDNDTAGVAVTTTTLVVNEGGGTDYYLALDTDPTVPVVMAVARAPGGDTSLTPAPASLTFTPDNWRTTQTVTITAAQDDDARNEAAVFVHMFPDAPVRFGARGGGYNDQLAIASLTFTETDDDTPGVRVSPTSLTVVEGSLSGSSYTLELNTEPSSGVTITLRFASGGNPNVTATPASVVFTPDNWNTAQTVKVLAGGAAVGSTATIVHGYSSRDTQYHPATAGAFSIANVAVRVSDRPTAVMLRLRIFLEGPLR